MYTLIIVLLILVAVLICGIVLIQESKGGGLASSFSTSNQVLGVRKTTDFLEKTTWTLAAILIVLCVLSSKFAGSSSDDAKITPTAAPAAPVAPGEANPLTTAPHTTEGAQTAAPAQAEGETPAAQAPAAQEAPAQEAPAAPAAAPAEGE